MELFSYRHGIKKNLDKYQIESVSEDLTNRLWTCVYNHYLKPPFYWNENYGGRWENLRHIEFCKTVWDGFFKRSIDRVPNKGILANREMREIFFKSTWDEKYSFIEFCLSTDLAESIKVSGVTISFSENVNRILEEEFAGYRIIDTFVTSIVDAEEIDNIERALTIDEEVKVHFQTALKYISDKTQPDYRNSIKESISAVEAICKKIVGNPNVTLGEALNKIEKCGKIEFHGAEKAGFSSLYGWTSTADGIRHGMMDSSNLCQEDAKFMLIACSAFVNLLKVKADKAGIKIS
jgi:hypothetical protein